MPTLARVHGEGKMWDQYIVPYTVYLPPKTIRSGRIVFSKSLHELLTCDSTDSPGRGADYRHAVRFKCRPPSMRVTISLEQTLFRRFDAGCHDQQEFDVWITGKAGCHHDFFALTRGKGLLDVSTIDTKSWCNRYSIRCVGYQSVDQL
nr:hypothetical protein [Massilia sp. IC2-278]